MLNESNIKALVFDIGQVIVRVNAWRAARSIAARSSVGPRRVLQFVQKGPCHREFQEGRLSAKDWYWHFREGLSLRMTFADFCAAWNTALEAKTILDEFLFRRLAKHYLLVLLSNTDPIHVTFLEKSYQFTRHFHHRLYSCEMGRTKPSPEVYRRAIRCAGVDSGHILYTDDVPEYVAAGQREGLQAIRFENRGRFHAELRKRGVLY